MLFGMSSGINTNSQAVLTIESDDIKNDITVNLQIKTSDFLKLIRQ